ncbi:MAG: hypothetical protein KF683_19090 [Rubrivivax sp.]|nr:hypothetical protein [Rubrivivax sp.]
MMLGRAALAMWWDMAADLRREFEHWHSHEHFPERLALPGFLRASRWLATDGGDGVFVLYELQDHASLSSPAYRQRLDAPTPWSTTLMPHHRHMQRAQCHVLMSRGAVTAAHAMTLRFSPAAAMSTERLTGAWAALAAHTVSLPGLAGMHLLRHDAPVAAPTTEQRLRGGDAAPDAVAIVGAYDAAALDALQQRLRESAATLGLARADVDAAARFRLSLAALAADVGDLPPPAPLTA